MASHTGWTATLAVVTLLQMTGNAVAWAQPRFVESSSPSIEVPTPEVNPASSSTATSATANPQLPQSTEQTLLPIAPLSQGTTACSAGQFLSVFSDVRPDDWAYEAVNQLAIGEPRCFLLTPQS